MLMIPTRIRPPHLRLPHTKPLQHQHLAPHPRRNLAQQRRQKLHIRLIAHRNPKVVRIPQPQRNIDGQPAVRARGPRRAEDGVAHVMRVRRLCADFGNGHVDQRVGEGAVAQLPGQRVARLPLDPLGVDDDARGRVRELAAVRGRQHVEAVAVQPLEVRVEGGGAAVGQGERVGGSVVRGGGDEGVDGGRGGADVGFADEEGFVCGWGCGLADGDGEGAGAETEGGGLVVW